MAQTLIGLGTDVLALVLLLGGLYRRRAGNPEMVLMFVALNLGLFAAMLAMAGGRLDVGAGFGLFGLLSLVRLRSATFSIRDLAYLFVVLVLALVNGIPPSTAWLAPAMSVVLLVAVALVDDARVRPRSRVLRMTLDRALLDPALVREEVVRRLGSTPLAVAVDRVDFVRETTVVAVRCLAEPEWWRWGEDEPVLEASE